MVKQMRRLLSVIAVAMVVTFGFESCFLPNDGPYFKEGVIEDIVGMPLPAYKEVKVLLNPYFTWQGDCNDSIFIEFDSIPSAEFIGRIKAEIDSYDSTSVRRWSQDGEHTYHYSAAVDDGGRVPECLKDRYDWIRSLTLSDTSKCALIRVINW